MSRKLMITLALVGTTLVGVGAASRVRAQDARYYPPIISTLAEKFGLSEDEVKDAFDEIRAENQVEMQTRQEERLGEAVSDGVITEEQKQLILDKQEEMRAQNQERRREHQAEMEAWASEHGIDLAAMHEYMGGGRRGMGENLGEGMGRMMH